MCLRFSLLSLLLSLAVPALCAEAPAVYTSDFARGLSGWSVQWTGSGKLDAALDPALPGPSGAPSLRTTLAVPSKGSVGVSLKVKGGRQWLFRLWAAAQAQSGSASVALQCFDADSKQIAWIGLGRIPTGPELRQMRRVASIPENATFLNLLVLHEGMQGTTHVADVRVEEYIPSPEGLAATRPKGPTRWATTGFFKGEDARAQDSVAKLLATAGITHTRGWIDWRIAEPEKGRYDFSRLEEQLATAERYGCRVDIVCIHGTPTWASGKSGPTDLTEERKKAAGGAFVPRAFWAPRDWREWEAFVSALVTRFRGRVAAWEIMNEPDLWSEGFCGSYDDYKQYLRLGYTAAKKADPACRVFTAAFVREEWLPALLADGMAPYFDGVCSHPYAQTPEGAAARLRSTRLTLIAAEAPRETWVTEIGYQSGGWKGGPGYLSSEEEKAELGRRTLALMAESAEFVCWYTGVEKGAMYGLLRQDRDRYVPMPIYYDYGALTGRLPKEGGPVQAEVILPPAPAVRGQAATVRLRAVNAGKKPVRVRFWPVGFVTNLGPAGDGLAAHDWEGTLAPGKAHEVTVTLTPRAEATGEYPVGLAVVTAVGNTLKLERLAIAP